MSSDPAAQNWRDPVCWAILWHSRNRLDGLLEYFLWHGTGPLLFRSRKDARTYIQIHYGYIKNRPDLRAEPHGWRLPRAVKVRVELRAVL